MRFSAHTAANGLAWAAFGLLILAAALVSVRLGFMGLLLLGAATCLVCVMAELDRDAPTWGVEVFKAQLSRPGSPEQRAAAGEQDHRFVSPLRFYRRCGLFLLVVGAAGFAVQHWVWGP